MVAIAAIVFAIAIPAVYCNSTVTEIKHSLKLEAVFLAKSVEKIVQSRPDMWDLEVLRLMELVSGPSLDGKIDEKEIRTSGGAIVVKADFEAPRPCAVFSVDFFDSGTAIGSLTIKRSIRTPIMITVLIGIFTFSFGYLMYFIFRLHPIKVLYETFADLNHEKEKFEKTLQAITDGVVLVDSEGKIQFINHVAESLTGKEASEATGCPLEEVYKLTKKAGVDGDKDSLNTLIGKGGKEHLIEETRTSVPEGSNGDNGTLIIVRDISVQEKAEEIRHNYEENIAQLRKVLGATVNAIVAIVETRDPYTAGHQRRVADLSRAIAKAMGFTNDRVDSIRIAATIHDIGKISVPAEILSKPTKLRSVELEMIKGHPLAGYNILKDIDFPWPIARMVLEHHERIDGSGYPNGLTGDEILIESKIIAVADVVEAIASHRPYRPALGIHVALEEILKNRGVLYDSLVVDTCLRLFNEKGYKMEGC
jgi:PAS domain S-box-containing protein